MRAKNMEAQQRVEEEEQREEVRQRHEAALICQATRGRSVEEWRDDAVEDFLSRRAVSLPGSVSTSRVNTPPEPPQPRPTTSGDKLPPLPPGCAQGRRQGGRRARS